jgi:hypothetical protein
MTSARHAGLGRGFGFGFCLGRVVDDVTEVAARLWILTFGDEQEVARVAQCLGYLRHRDVAVAIFFLGLFGEIAGKDCGAAALLIRFQTV